MNGMIFGGANLVLLIVAGIGFWFFRRSLKNERVQLVTEDEGASDAAD